MLMRQLGGGGVGRMSRFWLAGIALALTLRTAAAQNSTAHADADSFPAGAPAATLLHVTAPGRFAISVHSRSGTSLDLVDMITGPTGPAGVPGSADGRLDLLLDVGTYKLRLYPVAGAQGDVRLQVTGFADAAPPGVMPQDGEIDATLADGQQRSFWFTAADQQRVRLEAAGRALADLRLWRDGRDLAAVTPESSTIEPTHGHPLRDLLIDGTLPAGVYRATLYGGPALPWADGAAGMPMHLRAGAPDSLRAGWVGGQIGPFGSEIFRAAGTDTLFRLSMEGPASLLADGSKADIDKRARVPEAEVQTGPSRTRHWVEVRGPEHAPFQVRAMQIGTATSVYGPGSFFLTANTTGFGGDEVPATLVLGRSSPHGFTVVGSTAPEIGPGTAWRRRFNLNGTVSIIFHATAGGKLAATVRGVRLGMLNLRALDDPALHPPVAPETPGLWDIAAGWYELMLEPAGNAAGVADLTLGSPGVSVPVGRPSASSPSVGIGAQSLDWREHLQLFANMSPQGAFSLDARPLPVSLNAAPLRLAQEPGAELRIPVRPGAGTLVATEFGKGGVPVVYASASAEAVLPATDHPRLVSLAWHTEPAPPSMPTPEAEAARPALLAGTPRFFDIGEGDQQSFALTVPQGGLMRVETLGRLRTRGAIGTHFVPELQTAAANGAGHNMLLQGFLRAGSYHVDVAAEASSGHAGITAAPAPMLTTTPLLPGASVRASMPAGSGLVVPVDIAQAGQYRLDVLGLSRIFTARLEDAQGWPLAAAGPLDSTTRDLIPGRYRLLLLPEATDARAVIRLTRIEPTARLTGHGPHKLPFDEQQSLTWREPAGRSDPRTPDVWVFDLAAPSDISLSITDGMEGFLRRADGEVAGHFVGGHWFSGHLPQGAYRVEARSQGRNDRLDYALTLNSTQLQPGTPRTLFLPATAAFTLASDRVVSLTSFGRVPVRAVLRNAAGAVLARAEARDDDWNIALSRPLPAGAYTLALDSAAPPPGNAPPANVNDGPQRVAMPDESDDQTGGDQAGGDQGGAEQQEQPMPAAPDAEAAEHAEAAPTELTFSLPTELPARAFSGPAESLTGGGVQRLSLTSPKAGELVLAGASSAAAVVLSLEQRQGASWRSLALAQGLAPVLAVPTDGSPGAWRLSVWPVDGGALPVRVAARFAAQPAAAGAPQFLAAALPGIADGLVAAHVALPSRAVLTLAGAAGVMAGAWPGHAAVVPDGGLVAPQSDDLWLVAPAPGAVTLKPMPAGSGVTISIPPGERVALPRQSAPLTGWIAEASGQPGLAGALGMGVSANGAFVLARQEEVTAWNAGDGDTLRLSARPVPLALAAPITLHESDSATLRPTSATRVTLPAGLHRLRLDLPPGTAAVAGFGGPDPVTVWTGREAVSRTLDGSWNTLLLVNTGTTDATAGLVIEPTSAAAMLGPDRPLKQFFGARGSVELPVAAVRGQTLMVAGTATAVFAGADGGVRRGKRLLLTGPGRVTLEHGVGLVVAWLDGAGATPWVEGAPYGVEGLQAEVPLAGAAMRIDLPPFGPLLLRVRSTSPVILAMDDGPPMLFPAGAAMSRYLPPGAHPLRVISPQDGPLSGTLELSAAGVHPAHEGVGESVTIAPGDAALFGFTLDRARRVGAGVRAQPDLVTLRLLDDAGHSLASGAALLRDLPAGRYVLEASVPAGAPTSVVRPALVGLVARPDGPPADVLRGYLKK